MLTSVNYDCVSNGIPSVYNKQQGIHNGLPTFDICGHLYIHTCFQFTKYRQQSCQPTLKITIANIIENPNIQP